MLSLSISERSSLWINGDWRPASVSQPLFVIDPSTEETIGSVPAASPEEVDLAVAAANRAFPAWSRLTLDRRIGFIERLLSALEDRADLFADVISREVGTPLLMARALQVEFALQTVRSYLDVLSTFSLEQDVGGSLVVREPIGTVACITPWNVPLALILQKIVPALASGCTVVLKPSELTPLNAFLLAEVLAECDFPSGVFNLVSGTGTTTGEDLASHPDVDMVSLTGSTRAGRRVAALAAATIKRVHLELGGKSANIILPDADLETAVRAGVDQVCVNSGQACLAWSRMLVPARLHDEAVALAAGIANGYRVGDPRDPSTELGPLVSAVALHRVRDYIEQGITQGAQLAAGGTELPTGLHRGYYVRPTVFGHVDNRMTIAREEIFGPVLCILPYNGEDEAVRIANDSPYGLHGAVWSASDERALAVARRLRTGQVDINGAPGNFAAPFGGYKQSGFGRQCGAAGVEEFLQSKAIQLPARSTAAEHLGLIRVRDV